MPSYAARPCLNRLVLIPNALHKQEEHPPPRVLLLLFRDIPVSGPPQALAGLRSHVVQPGDEEATPPRGVVVSSWRPSVSTGPAAGRDTDIEQREAPPHGPGRQGELPNPLPGPPPLA